MRTSDRILYDDLIEAGLPHLADRAAQGEWNDYFGIHTLPQVELLRTLRSEVKLANAVRKRLIDDMVDGKYDGTKEESDEWGASPEGQEVYRQLINRDKRRD